MTQLITQDSDNLYTITLTITEEGLAILNALESFVCKEFKITKDDFKSEARYMPLPRARGAFTSILRAEFDFPLKMIGLYLGGRDHSTILMAEQRAKEFYAKNQRYSQAYDTVEKNFQKFLAEIGKPGLIRNAEKN